MTSLPGVRRLEQIMGMPILVDVRDRDRDQGALDEVFDWFRLVDSTFSTYKADSEISRLNRSELTLPECHPDVQWAVGQCRALTATTGGYFDADAVVPGSIDPSGLVKGWSVDRAATLLDRAGFVNYSISAGGDVRVRGNALPGRSWRVGIQHPLVRDRVAAVVEADDLAVATSGAYVRGDHIIDPHTGLPSVGVLSVTVSGPELAMADAYATAAYAMGSSGPEWTRTLGPYEAMTITPDDRVIFTAGFPRDKRVGPDFASS